MAEELVLTDPVVIPAVETNKYRVMTLYLSLEAAGPGQAPGVISVGLQDNNGAGSTAGYTGPEAVDLIKFLNTANLSTKSMHKRILEKLANDGKLPGGTVTGTPEV